MENVVKKDPKTPIRVEEILRKLSYSELKKEAKSRGLKIKNIKTEKLIRLLSSSAITDDMSFSTPEQKEINSSRKNKENVFDQDAATPVPTPRRGTYSVDAPSVSLLHAEEAAGPSVSSVENNVTVDECNVTILRGSDRKLRPRKVSFLSPKRMTPRSSPRYLSLKDRPKTPIASRKVSITTPAKQQSKKTPSTESTGFMKKSASKESIRSAQKKVATPNFKKIHQKAFDKMESIDDYHKRRNNSAKKLGLMNQSKPITRTKIPVAFGGIPFIPSVTSCANIKFNFAHKIPKSFQPNRKNALQTAEKTAAEIKIVGQQRNVSSSVKDKTKFDLQASLSKKLRYKPYSGPLKPLTESNYVDMPVNTCYHTVKEPVNEVVKEKRCRAREQLKGVRTNRRFELQMKSRNLLN